MADQTKSKLIEDNPIGNGLDAFRASFNSICGGTVLHSSNDIDQLAREDAQDLASSLLSSLQILPVARLLRSKSGGGTLRGDLLRLLTAVASDDFDFDRIKPLLNAAIADLPDDTLVWDQVSIVATESTPPPRSIVSSLQQKPWRHNMSSLPNSSEFRQARVQWWDAHVMCVLCPFCHEPHHHGFRGAPSKLNPSPYSQEYLRRVAHCDPVRNGKVELLEYQFEFPVDPTSGNIAYEIDKQNVRFVAGRACAVDDILRDDEAEKFRTYFTEKIKMKRRWTEATETEFLFNDFSVKRIDNVVSKMVQGNIQHVRNYLQASSDAQIFLRGVESWEAPHDHSLDDEDDHFRIASNTVETLGKTALHLAACEDYPEMVELLLSEGADVNAADVDGRTALMEAALWGRLDNTKILLNYGADKTLRCLESNRCCRAIDFAKPLRRNAKARRVRSGSKHLIYKEDTYSRDMDREEIVHLLSDAANESQNKSTQPHLDAFTYQKFHNGASLSLLTQYSIPDKCKTIACMYRGGYLPEVSAMSGWSHMSNECIQVAGRDWTSAVLQLYNLMQLTPGADQYDQGVAGQYNACHAEKQLIAYFVHKHLFLPSELELPDESNEPEYTLLEWMRSIALGELTYEDSQRRDRERDERNKERAAKMKFVELQRAAPCATLQKALILVSRPKFAIRAPILLVRFAKSDDNKRVDELSALSVHAITFALEDKCIIGGQLLEISAKRTRCLQLPPLDN